MCRVSRLHTRLHIIKTLDLLCRVGLQTMDTYIGHVARMEATRLPRKMLSSWVHHKRPRGAPEFTYGRGVYKALRKVNLDKNNWSAVALDRVAWRGIFTMLNM